MKAFLLFTHIALRNVRSNARRSLFTIIAIAFGILYLIVFQALKAGLHREMVKSTVQSTQVRFRCMQQDMRCILPR
jgi:ABC-type lipoprotein release transport system permease subunit